MTTNIVRRLEWVRGGVFRLTEIVRVFAASGVDNRPMHPNDERAVGGRGGESLPKQHKRIPFEAGLPRGCLQEHFPILAFTPRIRIDQILVRSFRTSWSGRR